MYSTVAHINSFAPHKQAVVILNEPTHVKILTESLISTYDAHEVPTQYVRHAFAVIFFKKTKKPPKVLTLRL